MGLLQTMMAEIKAVDSNQKAEAAVKSWLAHADEQMKGFMATSPGTKNCSLMAEWVATRFRVGVVDWGKTIAGPVVAEVDVSHKALPFGSGTNDVFYLTVGRGSDAGGHELVVIRDGNEYGLFHAWDGGFELFPKLNGGRDYNVHGSGGDAKARIVTALTSGWTVMPGCTMSTQWAVKRVA
jgi:hypothetical protein